MREPGCVFCRIVEGEVPSTRVTEDEAVLVIRDINPQAPTHVLVMPKQHIAGANELSDDHGELLGRMFATAARVASDEGIADRGYRLVINVGEWGGQTVDHLHLHVVGGRKMSWPPG